MTEKVHDSGLVAEGGTCQWMSVYEHSLLTASLRRPEAEWVTCCYCKNRVRYVESWVTVAFGLHKNRLPLSSFVHCSDCALTLDARAAWMAAFARDKAASLPDPEKVKREEELNRKLNPFLNSDA